MPTQRDTRKFAAESREERASTMQEDSDSMKPEKMIRSFDSKSEITDGSRLVFILGNAAAKFWNGTDPLAN
jgi:hypothetical protein